jgi:hypothetical protein
MDIEQEQKKLATQQLALRALEHLEWVELEFKFSDDCPEESENLFISSDVMAEAMEEADAVFQSTIENEIERMYFGSGQDEEFWGDPLDEMVEGQGEQDD